MTEFKHSEEMRAYWAQKQREHRARKKVQKQANKEDGEEG
jgi:hypothetical protein